MAEERELFSIMVTSGTEEKLIALATITNGAIAMDYDVHIFLAFWGTHAFRKGAPDHFPVSIEGQPYEELMRKNMKEKGLGNWRAALKKAKESGNVKIIACSNMIPLFDIPEDDFSDLVDEISGIASYIEAATKAKANILI
ncbi:MAG: DsrE/DsrF/DrsH-like family protein [Candidatus Heimdallarchaeaceae archaeon]